MLANAKDKTQILDEFVQVVLNIFFAFKALKSYGYDENKVALLKSTESQTLVFIMGIEIIHHA